MSKEQIQNFDPAFFEPLCTWCEGTGTYVGAPFTDRSNTENICKGCNGTGTLQGEKESSYYRYSTDDRFYDLR